MLSRLSGKRSVSLLAAMLLGSTMLLAGTGRCEPGEDKTTGLSVIRCDSGEPTAESYRWDFDKEASQLLDDIRLKSAKVKTHADSLEAMSRSSMISWQSHATELTQIKTEVNEMNAMLCRLGVIEPVALSWQQVAVNRSVEPLTGLAERTTSLIQYLNDKRDRLQFPEYRAEVLELRNEAAAVNGMLRNFIDYARARGEFERLERSLELESIG